MKAAIKTLGRLAFGLVLFVFVGWQAAEASDFACRDKLGRVITLQVPVKRAVMNQMYDFIPALNLWDQVAGLNRWAFEDEILNALCPELERRYARIGTGSEINMERLIKLRPDVIVTWTSKPEQIHFIGRQGIPVIGVYPESLREFYSVIDMLGAVFGREAEARRLKQRMNAEFKLIQPRVAGIQHKRKVVWLGSRPTYPSAGIGINDELIRLAGAVNPAGTIKQRNVEVSLEQLIKWNPDVIFIWGNAGYTAADLRAKPQWRVIKAVREGRVYKAPEFSTWSPLLAPVALWVAVRIYPEAFGDIDFDARADRFCRDIYGFSIKRIGGFVD